MSIITLKELFSFNSHSLNISNTSFDTYCLCNIYLESLNNIYNLSSSISNEYGLSISFLLLGKDTICFLLST